MKKKIETLAKNQVVFGVGDTRIFQSYDSVIAIKTGSKVEFSNHWDYSKTTMKYLAKFLGTSSTLIREMVASGEIKVTMDPNGEQL